MSKRKPPRQPAAQAAAWNWSSFRPAWRDSRGLVEMDAVPLCVDNENVVTRGLFKLAARGPEPGTFAVLTVAEAKIVRDRLAAWIAARESTTL